MIEFRRIVDEVFVLRYPVLDVNSVLILGTERALLVDTLSTSDQARELATAVRRVTRLPVTVVNTHFHFDHTFGNEAIADSLGVEEFWAHEYTIDMLTDGIDRVRTEGYNACLELAPAIASTVGSTSPLPPNRSVRTQADIDLGARTIRLWHPGPAHTRGDLVVFAGSVTIAGDLIEEGGPPGVDHDSDPANWSRVLGVMLPAIRGPVVPGHGAVVNATFVQRQRDRL